MFKVFREGVLTSTHDSYGEACKHARIQAGKDKRGLFTVYETDQDGRHTQRYRAFYKCSQVFSFSLTLAKLD